MKTFEVTLDYDPKTFADFIYDFLPEDYSPKKQQAYFDYTNIEEGYKLGTCKSLNLDVYEFRTKSKRDPRVTLTREVVSLMKKYGYNQNALVVFYSSKSRNWRLSLITTDYEVVNDKVKALYSNPRRFSFRLGAECKAHTPQTMLFKKGPINRHTENGKEITALEDLKSRFALEVVSKQFFNEYKVFYEDFVQYITGNRYVKTGKKGKYERKSVSKENTKIFSQFKKIADGDYDLACKYVRDYIKKFMGRLVFLQFLQKKGWLGVEENDSWGSGNKNFLLDLFSSTKDKNDFLKKVLEPLFFGMLNTDLRDRKKLFNSKKWNVSLLDDFKQIPYLNGGLFEDDILDSIDIKFPKEMFSNPAKAEKERTFNDKRDWTKEPYPFTESCGLLDFFARYNFTIDETDPADMEIGVEPEMLGKIFENLLEDNKDKGAFYTPKEIVQYMCRESLIEYLKDNRHSNKESHSELDSETKIRPLVTNHIADFNDTEKKELLKKLKTVKICDPAVGSGAFPMGMLNELFACRVALGENEEASEIKKQIVRENIYGVDIEKGAVDIARLRFWLAIIVDEKEPIPLPNLDYKIMQGNSLLESYEGIDLSKLTKSSDDLFDNAEIIQQLRDAIDGFYIPSDHIAKAKIRNQIREKVIQLLKDRQLPPATIKKLESIDLHSNSDFFLWHTWFSDVFNRPGKNGFDIVIGNPPYIDSETMTNNGLEWERKLLQSIFKNLSGNWDIYMAFFELGLSIGSIVSFITPDKWLSKGFGLKFRENQLRNRLSIITRAGSKIFENATVDAIITLFTERSKELKACEFLSIDMVVIRSTKKVKRLDKPYLIDFMFSENSKLIDKIDSITGNIHDYCVCEGACATSDFYIVKELIETNKKPDKEKYYKLINTGTIGKYFNKWSSKPISYDGQYNFPVVQKTKFEKKLGKTYIERAKSPKLILKGINLLDVCLDASGEILPGKSTLVICSEDISTLKFLMGILNSRLPIFYIKNKYSSSSYCGGITFTKDMINTFPLKLTREDKESVIKIVDKILAAKKLDINADTSDLESQIDELVYTLYGLTEEEKNIIRGK